MPVGQDAGKVAAFAQDSGKRRADNYLVDLVQNGDESLPQDL